MSSWVLLLFMVSLFWRMTTTTTYASTFPTNKKYNPVIFFKVPPGIIPECDEMEKCIRQVEKELHVKVDRMDVARNENAAALLSLLLQQRGLSNKNNNPPLLYHRESRQMVSSAESQGRIRALIKGRFLPTSNLSSKRKGKADPLLVADQDAALEQEDLRMMEDSMMTPLQRKGKQAIQERTHEKNRAKD